MLFFDGISEIIQFNLKIFYAITIFYPIRKFVQKIYFSINTQTETKQYPTIKQKQKQTSKQSNKQLISL